GRPSGVVEVLARYPVARGQHVVLLKVGRRVIVVHQGAQAMRTLSEFSANDDVADILARCEAGGRKADFSFDALLRQSDKSFNETAAAPAATESRSRADALRRSAGLGPSAASALEAYGVAGAEVETVDLTRRKGGRR
ncbi:MAG: flagellar biosynthetic protein FliO, partial [Phycisphaerales bacterium]